MVFILAIPFAIAGAVCVVKAAAAIILHVVGFTAGGVVAGKMRHCVFKPVLLSLSLKLGSIAAGLQGASVVAGSAFAMAQSIAAATNLVAAVGKGILGFGVIIAAWFFGS